MQKRGRDSRMKRLKQPRAAFAVAAVAILFVLAMLASCSSGLLNSPAPSQPERNSVTTGGSAQNGYAQEAPASGVLDTSTLAQDGEFNDALTTEAQQRVILKTAYLSLVVDNADETISSIAKMAEDLGGWVVTSSSNKVQTASGQEVSRGSITVRVPADQLDEAMTRIKSGGGTVESESVSGQDVTQQYVDLKSRLTNLEAAEAQLREIMASASKTEDVLAVYNQLVSTRGDIETVRGQIQYYDESSSYSSIAVDVTPKAIQEPIQIAGWSPGHTAQNAIAALVNLLQGLADLVITLAIIGVPLLLIIGLPAWFIWRRVRRRKPQGITPAPTESQS
jgi:Domain of unknown function (DUF4349)